ncbi:ABC transporter ATP-binding protein [Microbacterium sp.]|uniref:ABC transporter ATP-binding protein n=1 Tax=Microbacterium sp. TaxID=51671 RepID=UPI0039E2BEF7
MSAAKPPDADDPQGVVTVPPLPSLSAADAAASRPGAAAGARRSRSRTRASAADAVEPPPLPEIPAAVVAARFVADVEEPSPSPAGKGLEAPSRDGASPDRPRRRRRVRRAVPEESVAPAESGIPEEADPPAEVVAPAESGIPEEADPPAETAVPDPAEHEAAAAPDDVMAVLAASRVEQAAPDGVDDACALRLRGVAKSFGGTAAVVDVELAIPAGTIYGLVGPNGAGKTTTLSMIAGLLRPDAGSIEIAGVDLAAEPARAKALMGVLPDRLRTFDRLTGRQLLYYYALLRGVPAPAVEARVTALTRTLELSEALARPVIGYSAGMTKKIMLAGALIHAPRLLVLDEPFESVDPHSSTVILDLLAGFVAHGGTVVLSSHGMELVERTCSGVAVIVAGRILAQGTVEEVRGERTLQQRMVELAGAKGDPEGLEWLHTFSD